MVRENEQASAEEIEVTPEMIEAGIKALKENTIDMMVSSAPAGTASTIEEIFVAMVSVMRKRVRITHAHDPV